MSGDLANDGESVKYQGVYQIRETGEFKGIEQTVGNREMSGKLAG